MVSIPNSLKVSSGLASAAKRALGIPTRASKLFTFSAKGLMAFLRLSEIILAAFSHCNNSSLLCFSFC